MRIRFSSEIVICAFLILLCIPVVLPYFHRGYFPTHDGEWAVVRLSDMFRSIRDLQFPVRYSGNLNYGYGYPLFNFAYPFPYYFGLIFVLLKFGFVGSIKIIFVISVIFSAIGMYLFSRALWKSTWAGFVSAILYIYFPYRFVDLYVRGSIGESLAFALFPLILYFLLKATEYSKSHLLYTLLAGISYGVLIMTHNIMAVLFSPVLLSFVVGVYYSGKETILKAMILSVAIAYLLSAFFWAPALFEKNNILLSKLPIADRNLYFVRLDQLLIPSWGYGTPTDANGFTYNIGVSQIIVFLLSFCLLFYFWLKKRKNNNQVVIASLFFLSILILALFMFPISSLIWQVTPLLSEINYPWTLISQIGLLLAILGGFLYLNFPYGRYVGIFLAFLAILLTFSNARPQSYVDKGDQYYLTNEGTTTSSNEVMPLWVKEHPRSHPIQKVEILQGAGEISGIMHNSKRVNFVASLESPSILRINTLYYPGWRVVANNVEQEISYNNSFGTMDVGLPKGQHTVVATFSETPLRLWMNVVSLVTFIILFFLLIREGRRSIQK